MGLRRPEVPGCDARAVASSHGGRSLDRSPGALAVKFSGLNLIPMVSRRSVARRRPGCGLALRPWGVVFVTAAWFRARLRLRNLAPPRPPEGEDVLTGARPEGDAVSDSGGLQRPRRTRLVPIRIGLGRVGLAHVLHQHSPAREQLHQPGDEALHQAVQRALLWAMAFVVDRGAIWGCRPMACTMSSR